MQINRRNSIFSRFELTDAVTDFAKIAAIAIGAGFAIGFCL